MPLNQGFPGHNAAATFADIRRDLEGSVVRDAAGKMRAGVFPSHFNALVTGRSDMKVAIADFRAVIDRGGAIFMANVGADTSVTLDAAPAANRRIDLIYVTQQSTTLGDAASLPIFGFVKGTASATPVAPSLPANLSTALPLATVEIPAGATTTLSAGVVITQLYPYTAMAGGTVAVRNSVELAAWAPADGQRASVITDGTTHLRRSGAWQVTYSPLTATLTSVPGTVNVVRGDLSLDGDWVEFDYQIEYIAVNNLPLTVNLASVPLGWRPQNLRFDSPSGYNAAGQVVSAQMSVAANGDLQMRAGAIRVAIGTMRWKRAAA